LSTNDFTLAPLPPSGRARELWIQHAAGFILFEEVRGYALERLDPALDDHARAAAQKAIDDALYGLMMVIDGVSGWLCNDDYKVDLRMVVRLLPRSSTERPVEQLDLFHGDGVCMGYHFWREGDFGESPIAIPRTEKDGRQ
jgi:hypothetical protein